MDRDEIKAHLIVMRQWIVRKGLLTGECVAWARIKEEFGIGESDTADQEWLREYERWHGCVPRVRDRGPICLDDVGDGSTVYDDRPRPGAVTG